MRIPASGAVVALVVAITAMVLPQSVSSAAVTSIPAQFVSQFVDTAGANDVPNQKDLTRMGRFDDPGNHLLRVFWSWDDTNYTAQTGNACALFDSDGDGNANFAMCGEVQNGATAGTVVQTGQSPHLFSCGDARNDRCSSPTTQIVNIGTTLAGVLSTGAVTSQTGDLVTPTDPFANGDYHPDDTSMQVDIDTSVLPESATLLNVCSYPSYANGGNNDPSDCILAPAMGFLVVTKVAPAGTTTAFPFTVNGSPTSITGSGSTPLAAVVSGTTSSVTENVPSGWVLTNAVCRLSNGTSTGSRSGSTISSIEVQSGRTTTCTYTDDQPSIQVVKYVSVDGGTTWVDANTAPGPTLLSGTDPQFKFVVTNTGSTTLTNVTLGDSPPLTFTGCTLPAASLAVGASFTCYATGTWASGAHTDTATASGSVSGTSVTDTDTANYFGAVAGISVTKYVSPDGGTTWDDADTAPGPFLPSTTDPQYKFVVTNTGNVALTNVTLGDAPVMTLTGCTLPVASLAAGDNFVCFATGTWAAGQNSDLATASGSYTDSGGHSSSPSATNPAYYFGAQPGLSLTKTPSPTTYDTVGQTITYTYVVTNSGNVDLAGPITVNDDKTTVTCPTTSPLLVDASITCTATYTITQADLDAGSVTNIATATNGTVTSPPATATVTAIQNPSFTLVKSADPPSGTLVQPGDGIDYTVTYTNDGNVTLPDAVITDVVPDGTTYVDGSAACAAPCTASYDQATNTVTWHTGSVAPGDAVDATFSVTVDLGAGPDVVNQATVGTLPSNETRHPVATGDLTLTKAVDKASADYGDTLTYTLTVAATGTLNQTGVQVTDVVPEGTTYVDGSATCAAPCTATYVPASHTVVWEVGDMPAGTSVTGLVFKVTVDQPAANPDGSIPSRVVTNVGNVQSDQIDTTPSNEVTTVITAVLGEKQERTPATPLPFTGAPIQQLVSLALILLVVGAALASRRRRSG